MSNESKKSLDSQLGLKAQISSLNGSTLEAHDFTLSKPKQAITACQRERDRDFGGKTERLLKV